MKESNSSTEPQSSDFARSQKPPNSRSKWDERKSLMIKINPKIQPILQKLDSDYFEMFSQMGNFKDFQQHASSECSQETLKKIFFQKNYDQILIHFFQYLFDFELQTLQFNQKHQTFLSFGQWVENEVIFQMPDQIRLLNKKKSESKKLVPNKSNAQDQKSNGKSQEKSFLKRLFNDQIEEKKEKQIIQIESPKKKKVVSDQQMGVKFINSKLEKEKKAQDPTQKYCTNQRLIFDAFTLTRRIHKVNGPKNPKTRNNSKDSDESKKKSKSKTKTKTKRNLDYERKVANIKSALQSEVIVLESSLSEKDKSSEKIAQEEKICVNILKNLQISDLGRQLSESDKNSQLSNGKVASIKSKSDLQIYEKNLSNLTSQQFFQREYIQSYKNSTQQNPFKKNQIQQDIAEKQTSASLIDGEKQKRKLHVFRAKLSGLFRYSEKRFYIFPDFAPGLYQTCYSQNQRNNLETKPKSTSKSKKHLNQHHQ